MSDELVTLARFVGSNDAEAARAVLATEGIEAWLESTELVSMAWYLSNAVGDIPLKVRSEDEAAARAVLDRAVRQPDASEGASDRVEEDHCLACGTAMASSAACPECGWSFANADAEEADDVAPTDDEVADDDVEDEVVRTAGAGALGRMRTIMKWLIAAWAVTVVTSFTFAILMMCVAIAGRLTGNPEIVGDPAVGIAVFGLTTVLVVALIWRGWRRQRDR
ncbi:MAG: hypothetical protein R3B90_20985 [Planctomycetaceae bacterium]